MPNKSSLPSAFCSALYIKKAKKTAVSLTFASHTAVLRPIARAPGQVLLRTCCACWERPSGCRIEHCLYRRSGSCWLSGCFLDGWLLCCWLVSWLLGDIGLLRCDWLLGCNGLLRRCNFLRCDWLFSGDDLLRCCWLLRCDNLLRCYWLLDGDSLLRCCCFLGCYWLCCLGGWLLGGDDLLRCCCLLGGYRLFNFGGCLLCSRLLRCCFFCCCCHFVSPSSRDGKNQA